MATEYFNDAWRIPNNKNQSLVSNYSMEFDGTSDVISVNNSSEALNVDFISISAWYYPTSFVSSSSIISSPNRGSGYHSYNIGLTSNGNLRVILYTGANFEQTFTSAGLLNLNQWNFICMTYDGSNVTVTINTLSQSIARTGALQYTVNPTGNIEIGRRNGTSLLITGNLDQVSIFDYGLSASQVATLYGGGTALTNPFSLSPKPIAYYQLGDQSAYNGANYLVPNNSLQDYVFSFNGTSSKIDIASTSLGTSNTVSFWFYWPSSGNNSGTFIGGSTTTNPGLRSGRAIAMVGNSLYFSFDAAAFVWNNPWSATGETRGDNWNHIVIVRDASKADADKIQLSINNSTLTSYDAVYFATPNFSTQTNIANSIGQSFSGATPFEGLMSNISAFTTAFTQSQVTTLYNNGTPSDISSLSPVAWWKLNAQDTFDGTNWTIKDYAGSNDGTSSGMTSANLVQSNLQHTSGYSPYALDFDGTDNAINLNSAIALTGNRSVNFWFTWRTSGIYLGGATGGVYYPYILSQTSVYLKTSGVGNTVITIPALQVGVFYNMCITGDGTTVSVYINAVLAGTGTDIANITLDTIANTKSPTTNGANGNMSNTAIWTNTVLSQSEVTEIYNQGVPSNLNTFSGTAPTAWWQLGSNSSFNATTSQWTCLDEKGTNDGVSSTNMSEDDIVNGVGYSGNGLGTSTIEIANDAPYSTANGLSENMDVLDRTTDVPS